MTACAEALRLLHQPGSVSELRIPKAGPKGVVSGYFDDMTKMAATAARWDGRVQGVYTTLNPVLPDLLARAANRVVERAQFATADKDIVRRIWLPIDFDPARPAGISSSNAEHEAALEMARQCRAFLREQGWPDPIYADSGNGAHLDYRIDLPTGSNLVERVLRFLSGRFHGGGVHVDDANHNSARIWKLYGTRACKGDSTPARPHRVSAILECPSPLQIVTAAQLENLVGPEAPSTPETKPGRLYEVRREFNLDEWIAKYQHRLPPLGIKRPFDGGGWKREFENCPWNSEHTGRCAFIGFGSRGVVAACQHNSCQHKTWHDLKAVVGDTVTGAWSAHRNNGQPRTAPAKEPVVAPVADLEARADMPEDVLDGRLGEIYQQCLKDFPIAYTWPALLTFAGASQWLKYSGQVLRGNLYGAIVGHTHSGKTAVVQHVRYVLGIEENDPTILGAKFGSAEALMLELKDKGSCTRLLWPDELAHLLAKSAIDRASFPTFLTSFFYQDREKGGTAKDRFEVDCRLSLFGGIVEDSFSELFGSFSTAGLYDRMMFGLCPKPYICHYYPPSKKAGKLSPSSVQVSPEIWDVAKEWRKSGLEGRVVAIAQRVAFIAASVDGRKILRGADLAPALAFAKYQTKIRTLLKPNEGKNPDAQTGIAIMRWLKGHAPEGEWVKRRDLSRGIHSERAGAKIFNQALLHLQMNDQVEVDLNAKTVRLTEGEL